MRPDIEAARKRMTHTLGSKREIKKLEDILHPGETVKSMVGGGYGGKTGLLVLTDSRLLFYSDGWTSQTHEDFPLAAVSSVGFSGGMLTSKLTIHASGNVTDITGVPKTDGKQFAEDARVALQGARSGSADQPQAQAADDPMDQLAKLGQLKASGVLTDDEFAAKKSELLERM